MKILNIIGSPRKNGASARIAQAFVDEAQDNGAETKSYYLNGMNFRGCQGCETCHTKLDRCVLKDDLTEVLEAVKTADITVFSSPVYYGDTTGQFKTFFDRLWSLVHLDYEQEMPYVSRLKGGQKAVFIFTQGNEESEHMDAVERYSRFLEMYGYETNMVRKAGLSDYLADIDVSDKQAEMKALAKELTA